MIVGDLHLERLARVAQVLGREHRALLANQQGRRVRVAADVVGADAQIRDLQALDAVDV